MLSYTQKVKNFNVKRFITTLQHENIAKILGNENILLNDENTKEKYFTDWTRNYTGGSAVCFPRTTVQVSKLMSYCYENDIKVVPQGKS